LACALLASHGALAADETLEEAWWTGPMLAPSAATLPRGHMLIEPYLFDVITTGEFNASGVRHSSPRAHDYGSLTYLLYGFTDRLSAGMITRFGYNQLEGAPSSAGAAVGDLTLQAGYGLTQFRDGHGTPAIELVLQETPPTGRYDRLAQPTDGFGAGAYTTGLALYSQDYFRMPNGRLLRVRLDLTYAFSTTVELTGLSVYGTPAGFSGHASPGNSFTADAAVEYSVTRNWVLALDIVYQHNDNTHVSGSVAPANPAAAPGAPALPAFEGDSGTSASVAFAPAIEYNFSSRVGVLLGVRIIPVGRNTSATVTPAIALNMVF